jgi:hypothetical protein
MGPPQNGGAPCPDNLIKTKLCPVDCRVEWTNDGVCENGVQKQTATVVNQSFNGGAACPANTARKVNCSNNSNIITPPISPGKPPPPDSPGYIDKPYYDKPDYTVTPFTITTNNYNTDPNSSWTTTISTNPGNVVSVTGTNGSNVSTGSANSTANFNPNFL